MEIRLGYVAQNLSLGITPAHTITATNIRKIENKNQQIEKLVQIARENLDTTLEILKWNVKNGIYVYRLSSKLIPLATLEEVEFPYKELLKTEFQRLGQYIIKHDIRVSAHPDHFAVVNTPREAVFKATVKELLYHDDFMTAMGLDDKYKLVVHVGGTYGDKEKGKTQFIHRYKQLPQKIQKRLIVENDDKSYMAQDVLQLCEKLKIPMVLDVHHFMIHHNKQENLKEVTKRAFKTWEKEYYPPKIHFSTPKSEKEKRAHADYINPKDFLDFIYLVQDLQTSFDVMLEAKAKDLSVMQLKKALLETQ